MNLNFPEQIEKIRPPQEGFVSFIKNTASSIGRLTGFTNLTESVQAYRQKEYRKGTYSLAYGVTKMVVIGACVYKFFSMNKEIQQLRDSNDKNRSLQSENNQKTIDELKNKVLELKRNEEDKTQQLEDKSQQLEDKSKLVINQKNTIFSHQEQIDILQEKINHLNSKNKECTTETLNQKKTIDECSNHVKEQEEKINQLNLKNERCKLKKGEQKKLVEKIVDNLNVNPKKEEKYERKLTIYDEVSFPRFKRFHGIYHGIILADPDIDRDSLLIYEDSIKDKKPHLLSDAQEIIRHTAFRDGSTWSSVGWSDEKRCRAIKSRFDPKHQTDITRGGMYSQILEQLINPACNTVLMAQNIQTNK